MASLPGAYPAVRPTLEDVVRRVHDISTLPQIALQVMEVANDADSGARELKEVMEGDASLSSRVLRCVNSSQYAKRGKITNLQQAIAYLGMQQIRNLAVTASASKLFAAGGIIGSYDRAGLWRHLVTVGICARLIAMRLNFADFEDVFLAGLLHDIGVVFEDQHVHEPFAEVIQSLEKGKALSEIERSHLGFDHAVLGAKVAENWKFPPGVLATIRYHHNTTGYRGDQIEVIRCVEVANFICSLKGISSVGIHLVAFPQSAIRGLSLSKEDILVLAQDLDRELTNNENMLQI